MAVVTCQVSYVVQELLRKAYCTTLGTGGACLLRPYMLGWRSDFGLAGCQEPEQLLTLCELILTESHLVTI